MKKKHKIVWLIIILLLILSSLFLFFLFRNNKESLTLDEKKWIEDNKNNVIDISITSGIPGITYNGKGMLFDYLDYLSKKTGLSFNPVATTVDVDVQNDYNFHLTDKVDNNDILINNDNYILISKDNTVYNNLSEIVSKKIGVLEEYQTYFKKKLDSSNQIIPFKTLSELDSSEDIDSFIVLKSSASEYLMMNDVKVGYKFNKKKYFVLSLNGDKNLNSIIKKYYDSWKVDKRNSYNKNLLNDYYSINSISDEQQTDLKSKNYLYGYIPNGMYDYVKSHKLKGINQVVMKYFSDFADINIKSKQYNNYLDIVNDFNKDNIDIIFNNIKQEQLNDKAIYTSNVITSNLLIVSDINNNISINDIDDLKGKQISIIDNSKLKEYLENLNVSVVTYNNFNQLLSKMSSKDILLVDRDNFDFYKTRNFKNYKIDYVFDSINYNYVINGNSNELFSKLFNFYLNYNDVERIISDNYSSFAYKTINYSLILFIILTLIIVILIFKTINRFKYIVKKIIENRKNTLSKEDKLKYIDQLTSLKNRNYLNSKVEEWDESETYPQCIIVIDLNNIAYINDNHGREEGDNVIREAANILIQTQLPSTEIIRTDGNEFLIYAVGYKEKEIITYIRKLSKALKSLKHGFGAATGYSMILDEIKTFDDALNEATIEMKQSKEDSMKD